VQYHGTELSHIQANTDSFVTMMIDNVTVMISDMTRMIIDVMSRAVFGIHPYAYL
jgi:hypothetical protein